MQTPVYKPQGQRLSTCLEALQQFHCTQKHQISLVALEKSQSRDKRNLSIQYKYERSMMLEYLATNHAWFPQWMEKTLKYTYMIYHCEELSNFPIGTGLQVALIFVILLIFLPRKKSDNGLSSTQNWWNINYRGAAVASKLSFHKYQNSWWHVCQTLTFGDWCINCRRELNIVSRWGCLILYLIWEQQRIGTKKWTWKSTITVFHSQKL